VNLPNTAAGTTIEPVNVLDKDEDKLNTDSMYFTINVVNDTTRI
jgi:hypothetical protein